MNLPPRKQLLLSRYRLLEWPHSQNASDMNSQSGLESELHKLYLLTSAATWIVTSKDTSLTASEKYCVLIVQARVVHNSSPEWWQIKEAADKARDAAISAGDDAGELTCSELLEALELSRCLFLMRC